MGADATINIDVMLANLPKFKNDVSFVDDVLTKLGMNTGSKIDDSFKSETAKIETIAKSMKKDVDQTLDKPVKFTIKADNSDAERDVKETKAFLKDIPKSKITELKADNDGASLKIKSIKSEIAGVPDKKNTTLNADATQAKTETQELGRTAERTESKFMSLKDKLTIGAVAGIASNAIQVITGSFSELIGESVQASDSIDKFKSTMKLGGFGEKEINEATKIVQKYADDTVYDLSTVSNTTAQLAANGIKNYTELTQAAGNLNAQAGGSAETFKAVAMMLTQTAGAGKLTTENWNQLADAIPGASGVLQKAMVENGAYTGNFRDAMEKGEISADEFNQAITQLGMNDGAIQAAKTTTTFEGAIGNLQANIVGGINDIIKHLGKDKLTGIINGASGSVVGLFQHVSDVFSYLDKNKSTIGNITGNVKDLAKALVSGAWDQGKDILLAVADMFGLIDDNTKKIKDPLKQVDKIIENLADKVAKGGLNTVKDNVIKYAQSLFDKYQEEFGSSGSFDGAMNANGVYQYLVNVAEKVMKKFPGMTITSGLRPGDPYDHGKHAAIDIAYPGSMNGSSKYFDPANYAFEKFPSDVAYVITQNKVRDRKGTSGTGVHNEWRPWTDGDHYDHLHISGMKHAGDVFKAGSNEGGKVNFNASAGVEQWRNLAIKALKMEGQYSAGNLGSLLFQMQTESGGNPNAINLWDSNAAAGHPSKGLLQTIDSTFKAYARPGYDKNVYDPLSNILASIRYAVARYGSLGSAYRGVGYANGGEVDKPTLAWIGEDPNYAKEFIINPAKDSADLLIQKAIAAREQYKPTPSAQGYSSNDNSTGRFVTQTDLNQLINKINERPVKVNSILDGKQVGHSVDQTNAGTLKRKLYTARRA